MNWGHHQGPFTIFGVCFGHPHGVLNVSSCSSVQFSSVTQSCPTLCYPMNRSMPGLPVHHQHLEFTQTKSIESVMPSSHLILCRPLLLRPSIFPSVRVFSNESAVCIRWPKYWSFSFNISPSNEHPGLISFRMCSLAHLKLSPQGLGVRFDANKEVKTILSVVFI